MKKSAMLLSGILVFATAMLAQDSHSSSGSSSQYPSGSSQSGSSQVGSGTSSQSGSDASQSGSSGSMGSQSGSSGSMSGQTGTSGSQSGSMSSSGQSSSDQVEGCIYREATDYYIYPTHGKEMKVSGQDVSSHLGHHVKLHGSKQAGSTTASTGGGTGSAAGESSAAGSSQSAGQGSMAGSAGTSSSASTGNEFMVERVDMVSASCPSKIRKKIESHGGNLGSSDTGSTSGTTETPKH